MKNIGQSWFGVAVGSAALVGAVCQASAASLVLTPGNFGPMPSDLSSGPAGFIAFNASPNVQDGAPTQNFTAQVDSAVTVGNTYGASALTFWYRVTNVADPATGNSGLVGLSVPQPSGGAPSVALNQTGGTLAASSFGTLTPGGAVVTFGWVNNPVPKGNNSSWLRVETPFTQYQLNLVGVQDGTVVQVPALVPVPEPATYGALFGLGLAGFAAFRRFRA